MIYGNHSHQGEILISRFTLPYLDVLHCFAASDDTIILPDLVERRRIDGGGLCISVSMDAIRCSDDGAFYNFASPDTLLCVKASAKEVIAGLRSYSGGFGTFKWSPPPPRRGERTNPASFPAPRIGTSPAASGYTTAVEYGTDAVLNATLPLHPSSDRHA